MERHPVIVLALFSVFAQERLITSLKDRGVNRWVEFSTDWLTEWGLFADSINTPCDWFILILLSPSFSFDIRNDSIFPSHFFLCVLIFIIFIVCGSLYLSRFFFFLNPHPPHFLSLSVSIHLHLSMTCVMEALPVPAVSQQAVKPVI